MALGTNTNYQNNNTQNNKNNIDASYYSRLRIKNPEDNLALTFTFWSGLLKISIVESGSAQEGRNNELASIHLSPTKARIMSEAVKRIIDDPEGSKTYGVDTGTGETRGFIAIGREMGIPFLFIGKVTKDGKYESSQRYRFVNDYNYLLNVHDLVDLKCSKEFQNKVELEQLKDMLTDYARAASGAYGAMSSDIARYESARTANLIRKIADNLGVSNNGNGGQNKFNSNRSNNSYFSNADVAEKSNGSGNKRSNYQSVDDLEDELG